MRVPEKALVLGSQGESPSVPPALLFPKKLVLQQVFCVKTLAGPLVTLLGLVFSG